VPPGSVLCPNIIDDETEAWLEADAARFAATWRAVGLRIKVILATFKLSSHPPDPMNAEIIESDAMTDKQKTPS
jgi:hypothetical protein